MKYFTHIIILSTFALFLSCAKENAQSETKASSEQSNGTAVVERYDVGVAVKTDANFKEPKGSYLVQMEQGAAGSLFGNTSLTSSTFYFESGAATINESKFKVRIDKESPSKGILTIWDSSGKIYLSGKVLGSESEFTWFVLKQTADDHTRSYYILKFKRS